MTADRDALAELIWRWMSDNNDDYVENPDDPDIDATDVRIDATLNLTRLADAILAAGWRAPLEREPDDPYPYGWSEDADTCKRRGHQLTHADRRRAVPCWSCRRRKQQSSCTHEKVTARHGGILGMRYFCASCGIRMPEDEAVD